MSIYDMIKKEIERLKEKTDEEIMKIFSNEMFFPSMVHGQALEVVMKEREIEPADMTIVMSFKTRDGIKEIKIQEA